MTTENINATDESLICALVECWVKAIREKNVNAVLSECALEVVMFNLAPPLHKMGVDEKGISDSLPVRSMAVCSRERRGHHCGDGLGRFHEPDLEARLRMLPLLRASLKVREYQIEKTEI